MNQNENRRIEWVKNILEKIPEGSRILDAGSGEQPFRNYCQHLQYVSQDFAAYNPQDSKEGLHVKNWKYAPTDIVSDILHIPVPDESFDAILCTEVFEHIPHPMGALDEFSRILKKEGLLILTAPFCSLTHFAPFHFYTGFNRYFYEAILPQKKFEILKISPNGNYFEYINQEIGRMKDMVKLYHQKNFTFFEKTVMKLAYRTIKKYGIAPNSSHELLNFGYHVLAKKI